MKGAWLTILLMGLFMTALAPVGTTDSHPDEPVTAEVTLRVAPTGFVVPGHWATGTEAVWLVDPVEQTAFNAEDGIAGCQLTVPDLDENGTVMAVEVLDHAAAVGCISGWQGELGSFGFFVTEVDGLEQVAEPSTSIPALWWFIQKNGHAAPVGVSSLGMQDGSTLSFVYYAGI